MLNPISISTLKRMPLYLNYLKELPQASSENISATTIAQGLNLNQVQVRKDLATVSGEGRPKIGYIKRDLIEAIECFLCYNNTTNAVIVGAGKLGTALLSYDGFKNYGLDILAAFDIDNDVVNRKQFPKKIFHMKKLNDLCNRLNVKIGIITVPREFAQDACDALVESGVLAIWNFAPTNLKVPKKILVQNENMSASLAVLSRHLSEQIKY